MDIERRDAGNIAIVLIDYVTGFANLLRTQTINENIDGAVGLAKIAMGYNVPLVVTLGAERDPRGGLYPELKEILKDHPLVHRRGAFDSFDEAHFEEAVAATGRRHLVIAGVATEGCVIHTITGALRRGYRVSAVLDAIASFSPAAHDATVLRMLQLGVMPTTWLSLAAELQRSYENLETLPVYGGLAPQVPPLRMLMATVAAAQASVSDQS